MPLITTGQINDMTERPEHHGFGYLGHEHRTAQSDRTLRDAANQLGLSNADVFLWANSRYARHWMDVREQPTLEDFIHVLRDDTKRGLPALQIEEARA